MGIKRVRMHVRVSLTCVANVKKYMYVNTYLKVHVNTHT